MTAPPGTSASDGHDHVEDAAFIARVEQARARDQRVKRFVIRALPWLLIAAFGFFIATTAFPAFITFNCRAMSSEAKSNLKSLHVSQRAFFAEHDRYSIDMDAIGWRATTGTGRARYSYYVRADKDGYDAVAIGAGPILTGDVWRIGTDGAITQLANGCH